MPMRDGVKLAANVFLPAGTGPWPTRTPYDKSSGYLDMMGGSERYTSRGIALVVQDVRGKGRSEGYYSAFSNDIADGYDTIEWIAKQPWSNGNRRSASSSASTQKSACRVFESRQDRTARECQSVMATR